MYWRTLTLCFTSQSDGRRIVIPNSELFTNPVTVNTAFEQRRLEYDIGIGYGDDIAKAKEIMLVAVNEILEVLKEPTPDAIVVELTASTVSIRLRWWVHPPRSVRFIDIERRGRDGGK